VKQGQLDLLVQQVPKVPPARLVLQDQVEVHHHPVVVELCYSMQMEVLWDTH
jgi:hypothetical protein